MLLAFGIQFTNKWQIDVINWNLHGYIETFTKYIKIQYPFKC